MAEELHPDLRGGPFQGQAQLERLDGTVEAHGEERPQLDVWLEQRLSVFEQALDLLEARQEKTEQDLRVKLALLEEAVFSPGAKKESAQALIAPSAESVPQTPVMLPVVADPDMTAVKKDMRAFLAEARKLAKVTALPIRARRKRAPRWIAWGAAGSAGAVVITALVLGTVAGASAPLDVGVAHRQVAVGAWAREIALADSGDVRAETVLAFDYLKGGHVVPDHRAAARWARAAAAGGDPMAQNLLAAFYREGDGVPRDAASAFRWFEAAALRGNLKAMHNLALAYAQGVGTLSDAERAAAWFNRAALQGYTDSQFDLAVLYERGEGVKQNPLAALKWYLIAARSGDVEADRRASQLAAGMPTEEVAQAQSQAVNFLPMRADRAANRL